MRKKTLGKIKNSKKQKEVHKIPNSNKRAPKNSSDKKKKKKKKKKELKGHELTVTQVDSAWQVVYGRMKIGGVFTFMHLEGGVDRKLHIVITLACHQLQEVEKILLNNVEVGFASSSPNWTNTSAFIKSGDPKFYRSLQLSGGNNAELASALPTLWTADHKQQGRAHVYCLLKFHGQVEEYSSGLPDFTFIVKGKPLYDPRTLTTTYSNNVALCALDYLRNTEYGVGATYPDDFDLPNWEEACNICDENVNLAGGGTEKRYTFNGAFDMTEDHDSVLDKFESAMGGTICFWNGKWRCFPAKYRTPTVNITIDDIRSPIRILTKQTYSDIFNAIKARYIDETQEWEVTDAPLVKNSTYQAEDGKQIFAELDLDGVTSSPTAQRLAKIELERNRQGIEVSFDMYLGGYELQPEDTVTLTLSEYGWSSKVFVVTDTKLFVQENKAFITVFLRETASGIYTDSMAETAIDLADNTTLPSPSDITEPTGLTLESGTDQLEIFTDGTIHCRIKVSWDTITDQFVTTGGFIDCQYRKNDGAWVPVTSTAGDSTYLYISNVQEGASYDVRIRARNYLGYFTDWVESNNHVAVGKTAPPSDVTGFTATLDRGIILFSFTPISDLDVARYEIRQGASWASATVVNSSILGNSYSYEFQTAGSYTFLIKAIDTSGNYSNNATSTILVINAPSTVQNITASVIDNNIILKWTPPLTQPLPVDYYNIYVDSNLVGRAYGTFFSYFVTLGGSYNFDIVPIDIGGNIGTLATKTVNMFPPPDYILRNSGSLDIDSAITFTNCLKSDIGESFLASIITGETWEEHFVNNSYDTPQDQIDAGYDYYLQPSNSSDAIFEQTIDLGAVVAGSRVSFDWTETVLAGVCTITPLISYKENSGDAWTDGTSGEREIYANNFRYIKFKLTIESTTLESLVEISALEYRVDVKKQTDSGRATSSATLPTTINFNLSFLDIEAINVTAQGDGSASYNAIYDFTDVPNPTSFDVYIFDTDTGAQVAVDFSWSAEGFINPV